MEHDIAWHKRAQQVQLRTIKQQQDQLEKLGKELLLERQEAAHLAERLQASDETDIEALKLQVKTLRDKLASFRRGYECFECMLRWEGNFQFDRCPHCGNTDLEEFEAEGWI